MANEYTHVIQAKGKDGSWKNMTKHIGQADAKSALADAKTASKGKSEYRIVPFGGAKPTVTKPAAKPAAKSVGASKKAK